MMKKLRKLLTALMLALTFVAALALTACKDKPNDDNGDPPPVEPHDCTTQCPECGMCLDMDCTNPGCDDKCGDYLDYDMTFEVVDLKVAKANVTVNPSGYVSDFNKTGGGSIVFSVYSSEAATVTLEAYVSKTSETDVFTDVITVTVNDGEPLDRPSKIHALEAGESGAASRAEINLGCIEINEGVNKITFLANGDGAHAHNFYQMKLIGDPEFELRQATEVSHTCESECDTCGGCKNFSCYNPGCAAKCTCESDGLPATLFWVCDERCETNRAVNPELTGIGCSWGQETRMTYVITASEAGTVKFGAVTSSDSKNNVLFTDQFAVTVNGTRVPQGTGFMPASESGKREWNDYRLVVAGEMTLKEGRNTVVFSQTPDHSGTDQAYNFQSFIVFGNGTYGWFEDTSEHSLTKVPAVPATCAQTGSIEYWECSHCDKLFADEYGETEILLADTVTPVDPTRHVGKLDEDGMTIVCENCDANMGANFNAMDSRCIFTGEKDAVKNCLPGGRDTNSITFNVNAASAGTVKMYVNVSLISTSWKINFNNTWTVTVGDTNYKSDTIHNNVNGTPGATQATRGDIFLYEYVCDVELAAGNNVIVFTSTGGGDYLNFKDMALVGDVELDWYVFPVDHVQAVPSTCTVKGNCEYWLDNATGKKYADEALTDELTDVSLALDPDNHAHESANGSVVSCADCNAFLRKNFAVNDSRNTANRATNADGIGSSWGNESRVEFTVYSANGGIVDLYLEISQDSKSITLTDLFKVYVNDAETAVASETATVAGSGRNWTAFTSYNIGKITLSAGANKIVVSFVPTHGSEAWHEVAYNFRNMALGTEDCDFMYEYHAAVAATCNASGSVAYYVSAADGKKYSDSALTTELADEDITVPADPSKHVGVLGADNIGITCSGCGKVMGANFSGLDDNCILTSSKSKDDTCIPTLNAGDTITFNVYANAACTVKMYTNVSAITGSYKVEYNKTWTVKVGETDYTSETIHHYENDGNKPADASKWTYYAYEYVCDVELAAGNNTIVFTATGKEVLNFKDMALISDGVTLGWAETDA